MITGIAFLTMFLCIALTILLENYFDPPEIVFEVLNYIAVIALLAFVGGVTIGLLKHFP